MGEEENPFDRFRDSDLSDPSENNVTESDLSLLCRDRPANCLLAPARRFPPLATEQRSQETARTSRGVSLRLTDA